MGSLWRSFSEETKLTSYFIEINIQALQKYIIKQVDRKNGIEKARLTKNEYGFALESESEFGY